MDAEAEEIEPRQELMRDKALLVTHTVISKLVM